MEICADVPEEPTAAITQTAGFWETAVHPTDYTALYPTRQFFLQNINLSVKKVAKTWHSMKWWTTESFQNTNLLDSWTSPNCYIWMLFVSFNFHIYILQGFTQSLNSTICHQVCYLQSFENCLQHILYPLVFKQSDIKLIQFQYWTS